MAEGRFVMVSEWMAKGNINEFAKANPNTDRLGLVRFSSATFPFACTDNRTIVIAFGSH